MTEKDLEIQQLRAELKRYKDAEKDGRLVVLPCNVEDTVYIRFADGSIRETEVGSIHQWSRGVWKISTHTDRRYQNWTGYEISFDAVGKSLFLTREAALETMRG